MGLSRKAGCTNVPMFLINETFCNLSIETRIVKIGQYLADLCNYNSLLEFEYVNVGCLNEK